MRQRLRLRLPVARGIAALGAVSLLTDVAGEMVQPLLPLYLVAVGAGALAVGVVEGVAEALVSIVKAWSGRVADRLPRRKPLVVAGYGIAALAKPALALASAWPGVLALRSLDRVGKGLRGAPRDAMVADMAQEGQRGLAFGFHRAADTAGAIVGPLLALALLAWLGQGLDAMRLVFLLTAIPMGLALALLVAGVREAPVARAARARGAARMPPGFGSYLAVSALFALGNVSYAFLLLRATQLGAEPALAIGLYLVFNVVYAAAAIPMGRRSDRRGPVPQLVLAFGAFAVVMAGFALAPSWAWTLPFFALFGVFHAGYETVGRALAVELAPAEGRATALGYYHATVGAMALPAGLLAGLLWERVGPEATFAAGAALGLLAAAALPLALRSGKGKEPRPRSAPGAGGG